MARFHIKSGLLSCLFTAGLSLLLFLILLSGSAKNPSTPLNKFYWVSGSTSGISGAPSKTAWTYWGYCELVGNKVKNCNGSGPAVPISPVDNFSTTQGVPKWLVSNQNAVYYLSRVGWSCILIALIFGVIAFLLTILSIFSFHIQGFLVVVSSVASLFTIAGAAIMTAAVVLVKNHLNNGKVGRYLMGFLWAAVVCSFIVAIATFGAWVKEAYSRAKARRDTGNHHQDSVYTSEPKKSLSSVQPTENQTLTHNQPAQYENPYDTAGPTTTVPQTEPTQKSRGINFLKINRNKRIDEESDV